MAKRNRPVPQYGATTVTGGGDYYRTRIRDDDGNRITLPSKGFPLMSL